MSGGHAHALYQHGDSPLHRAAPHLKIVAGFAFLVAVVVTPREAVWAFGAYLGLLVSVIAVSGLRVRFVVSRMVVALPFFLAAATLPFIGGGERLGWLSIEGLWGFWNIGVKMTVGVLVSVTIAGTTEASDIVRGLEALRVPRVITAIMGLMIRYLDVVVGEVGRMRVAMRSRGYAPRGLGEVAAIGRGMGSLFIRSYERGERVYLAMASRGYAGRMPAPPSVPSATVPGTVVLLFPALGWAVAVIALAAR